MHEATARGLVERISWSSYQRILTAVDLRPHRIQGWVHSPDPAFREKVTEITDLYLHHPVPVCLDADVLIAGLLALQSSTVRSPSARAPATRVRPSTLPDRPRF